MTKSKITDQRWARTFIKNVGRRKFKNAFKLAQQGQSAEKITNSIDIPLSYAEVVIRKLEEKIVAES
jgi:hypothetical protein